MKHSLFGIPAIYIGLILVVYHLIGVAGMGVPATREIFLGLMPLSLLMGAMILFSFHSWKTLPDVPVFVSIALGGYLIEIAGVLSGLVFGEYSYGSVLGPKWLGTPPLIGLNWLMLTYAMYALLEPLRMHALLKILIGASALVVYDYIMEPVAISLGMWDWGSVVVPIQNYIAWFVISFLFLGLMHLTGIRASNKLAPWLLVSHLLMFLLLQAILVWP